MQFSDLIKQIDAQVRRECPAAQVSVYDHTSARWSCDRGNVSLTFLDDAYKIVVEHAGVVIYQSMDLMDEEATRRTARSIAVALQDTAA